MKNLVTLHEAIALALLDKPDRSATFDEVAVFIESRNLFPQRKGNIHLSKQVMLRSTKSSQRYAHLFEQTSETTIRLKNFAFPQMKK
ncbi:MAG TPA: hypothetical protein VHS53_03745 [Mucilaginibacter sp.]|jgi:uncharacterized protein with von Willebrand factor type A (vWA) domain|nr:hypothetical protein [Mucilaginibacter sp.]